MMKIFVLESGGFSTAGAFTTREKAYDCLRSYRFEENRSGVWQCGNETMYVRPIDLDVPILEETDRSWEIRQRDDAQMVCADCDWFTLEPGKSRTGVCFAKWMPNVEVDGMDYFGAYGRAFSFNAACDDCVRKGSLERLKPYRIGE